MTETFVDITADEPAGGGARRWLAGPPGALFGALTAANVVLTLVAYAAPGRYLPLWLACVAGWIALGLAFAARLGLVVARDGRRALRTGGWRWAAVAVLVAATAAATYAGAPVRAGLQLAKPAMVSFAEQAGAAAPERVGPYRVERAERLPGGGARFLIAGTGFLDPAGFAYSPQGEPPRIGEDGYEHLSGPWYVWTENW